MSNNNNLFAEQLKIALKKSGKTQKELAEITGISPATITEYLKSKYQPKQDKIDLIASALNVNRNWFKDKNAPMRILSGRQVLEILEKHPEYSYTDEELYDMEFLEVKMELSDRIKETLKNLPDQQIYDLCKDSKIEQLLTIDKQNWELLILSNQLKNTGKDRLLDYANILNKIPEFLSEKDAHKQKSSINK